MSAANRAVGKVLDDPVKFAIAAGIVIGIGYFLTQHVLKRAAAAAGGAVSGRNAITEGTPYYGTGIVATPAAVMNSASGGLLQSWGESLGGWLYDVTHKDYDPNSGLQTAPKTVSDGAAATDLLWGRIGNVTLRAN